LDHNGIKLKLNNKRNYRKYSSTLDCITYCWMTSVSLKK
jgi:hypothetical protein